MTIRWLDELLNKWKAWGLMKCPNFIWHSLTPKIILNYMFSSLENLFRGYIGTYFIKKWLIHSNEFSNKTLILENRNFCSVTNEKNLLADQKIIKLFDFPCVYLVYYIQNPGLYSLCFIYLFIYFELWF